MNHTLLSVHVFCESDNFNWKKTKQNKKSDNIRSHFLSCVVRLYTRLSSMHSTHLTFQLLVHERLAQLSMLGHAKKASKLFVNISVYHLDTPFYLHFACNVCTYPDEIRNWDEKFRDLHKVASLKDKAMTTVPRKLSTNSTQRFDCMSTTQELLPV